MSQFKPSPPLLSLPPFVTIAPSPTINLSYMELHWPGVVCPESSCDSINHFCTREGKTAWVSVLANPLFSSTIILTISYKYIRVLKKNTFTWQFKTFNHDLEWPQNIMALLHGPNVWNSLAECEGMLQQPSALNNLLFYDFKRKRVFIKRLATGYFWKNYKGSRKHD